MQSIILQQESATSARRARISNHGPTVTLPDAAVEVIRYSTPVDGEHEKLRPVMVALDADGKRIAAWEQRFIGLTQPPSFREVDPEGVYLGFSAKRVSVAEAVTL